MAWTEAARTRSLEVRRRASRAAVQESASKKSDTGDHPALRYHGEELARREAWLEKLYGEAPHLRRLVKQLEREMRDELDESDVCIHRSRSTTVEELLASEDGRMKSQFETGRSNGLFDPAHRAAVEEKLFGIDSAYSADERPIYGTLYKKNFKAYDTMGASQYGDYIVKLKPEVKNRTTYTGSDSLALDFFSGRAMWQPSPIKRASVVSLMAAGDMKSIYELSTALEGFGRTRSGVRHYDAPYAETQIFGQVRRKDIAEIIVRPGGAITPRMKELAAAAGIPIRKLAWDLGKEPEGDTW